jgi:hypothetical protein
LLEGNDEVMIDDSEKFLGFYSADGYWVDKQIDLLDRESSAKLIGIVPEIVAWEENDRFKAAVCVNGLMLLRMKHLADTTPKIGNAGTFNESVEWLDELFDYANVMQLCIESESIKCGKSAEVMAVAVLNSETCTVGFIDGQPVNRSHESSRSLSCARYEMASWVARGMEGPAPLEATSTAWTTWQVVSKDAVEAALKKFSEVSKGADMVKWLSFFAKAKTAFANNDYRVSLTLLWFVIESASKKIWREQDREVDRNTSMANITQGLQELGEFNEYMVQRLDRTRAIRNKLVHEPGSTWVLPAQCMEAAGVVIDLIERDQAFGFKFKWESSARF